ncbi:MAG: exodeoxyribonuclease V subunit gamma [Moraxellaceae bacterium]|nr:exodeoxyribonuclease V subunit gamma [Moraxellaceae bacterium]
MLTIYQSHNLPTLFEGLNAFLGQKQDNPFQPLTILVPSLAIGRWLHYQWAQKNGVSANLATEFPANFMWHCFSQVVPQTPKSPVLSPEAMQWRLFSALDPQQLPQDDTFLILHRYLERNPHALGRWQLAGRIAEVFGYYRSYRRDWLDCWREGQMIQKQNRLDNGQLIEKPPYRHQEWQAALWQQLFAEEHHQQGHLLMQFYQQLQQDAQLIKLLPERLAVFTTVRLPPNELDFFRVLSEFIEVCFYHFNPSSQYWADSVDEKWLAKMQLKQPQRMALYDKGHPLLTAWGKQHRDTFRLLSQLSGGEQENDWLDDFPELEPTHLLSCLQHSIHELEHEEQATWTLQPQDKSIQVHSCHSLTRQLEVLHDTLLHLFAQDNSLKPQDIVVMLPDIASAGGAIEAVFGTVSTDRYIPWQLTGVASVAENSLWRAFEGLYRLSQERFTLSAFIDWLSLAPVLSYYGLLAEDIERCVILLEKAGVYRNLDGKHRAQISGDNSDTDDVHSFLFGLERLLLATALPSDYQQLYVGIQPVADIEASDFALIGTLCQAVSDIAERRHAWQQKQAAYLGLQQLQQDLSRFFSSQVGTRAWDNLNKAIEDLFDTFNVAATPEPIALSLLLADLAQRIAASAPGAVPGGVVHFSRLGALRLLPYRVIAILGLEDTAFPRREQNNEFDLLSQDDQPRAGDRSRRDDDKAMFLEALMTAQDNLLLFYNGFSQQQMAHFPPSALISQLLEYLGRRVIGGKKLIEEHCCIAHRLQAFSPSYFTPNAPQATYAHEWLAAAKAVIKTQAQPSAFVDAPWQLLHQPEHIQLDDFYKFYRHPAQYFLTQQLKLQIPVSSDQQHDEEPLRLDNLAKWKLRQTIMQSSQQRLQLRASGQLPVGVIGDVYYLLSEQELQPLKRALDLYQQPSQAQGFSYRFESQHGTWQLNSKLPPIKQAYQLSYSVSKLSAKVQLQAWLQHVAWQLAGANKPSYYLCLESVQRYDALSVEQAQRYVQQLYHYYYQGLQQPLLLEIKTAFEYLAASTNPKKDPIVIAANTWQAQITDDVFWRQVIPEDQRDMLPETFIAQTMDIYQPLLTHSSTLTWQALAQHMREYGHE